MTDDTAVVDLGAGNFGNLLRALRRVGGSPRLTRDPEVVRSAGRIVLPGVGAFGTARRALAPELARAIEEALAGGRPLLGICVGYQILFEASTEDEDGIAGLGWLPGTVTRLPLADGVPVPHIGWNRLRDVVAHPLLEGLEDGASVYFVHAYAPEVDPVRTATLARTLHGRWFPSIAAHGPVMGAQFHPEKSAEAGLRLLGNFLGLGPGAGNSQ